MIKNFEIRLEKHENLSQFIDSYLTRLGFEVTRTGIEAHRLSLQSSLMKLENNETARFARFQPDGLAINVNESIVFYYDVKAAQAIEKGPYLNYLKLAQICKVFLFIKPDERTRIKYNSQIARRTREEIIFNTSLKQDFFFFVPLEYPREALLHWGSFYGKPVDVDGFVDLRTARRQDFEGYMDTLHRSGGSGTSFRNFKFAQLKQEGYLIQSDKAFKKVLEKTFPLQHRILEYLKIQN
jgi:hypothetical protein